MGRLRNDINAIKERDPAARTSFEIFMCYSGLHAIIYHRVAAFFYKRKWYFVARRISQRARRRTGIEIHPAAKLGNGLFIDHGMGVVIGETAEIGDNCTIYQGVTLGGTGKECGKRHPTLGNNVVIGAGAKVLGSFTVGDNSKIAAGAVVLEEVPPNCTAVGVPARIVKRDGKKIDNFDNIHIVDPYAKEDCKLQCQIDKLKNRLDELTEKLDKK
ncbi:MAG: serine O-acetyltransferase [Clostridiales bacterium]|nr:MAG: serine O-acetyltransferase [Clostridiales bacterium]